MTDALLFVDFENISNIDLASVPSGVRVPFFSNAAQKSVPKGLVTVATKLGERLELIEVEGYGKNALDFHIAFYLGERLSVSPKTRCVILTRDQGFDPLIKHLTARGFAVRRAATLTEAFPKPRASAPAVAPCERPHLELALQLLIKMPKANRPRKRKSLVAHLHAHFGKVLAKAEIEDLVSELIRSRKVAEAAGALTYSL
jgi:PIN domain-containing protein